MTTQPQPGSPEWLRRDAEWSESQGEHGTTALGLRAAAERIDQLERDKAGALYLAEKAEAERDRLRSDLCATAARLGDAEQERDWLREDKERLDWLDAAGDWHGGRVGPLMGGENVAIQVGTGKVIYARGVRDAIDAARKDAP
jgi:hypothetical protein